MPDVVVIGGGPAGAVAATLLAEWGHQVVLVAQPIDPARGLVNSLPPSTSKVLHQVGIADLVAEIGFPTSGNAVWWGDDERVAAFSDDGSAQGFQVFRPTLDQRLTSRAAAAGARVISGSAIKADVGRRGARVVVRKADGDEEVSARIAIDATGRSGVIARQGWRQAADVRMQALLGNWSRDAGWHDGQEQHTAVETYDDGWAWTVPTSVTVRHTGVMVHGGRSRLVREATLDETYRRELSKAPRLSAQAAGARLDDVWACDASMYCASAFAGEGFLLIGDAGATIDPLSSFGLKKALTSAWLGAICAHTRLIAPEREPFVNEFFTRWERDVYVTHLERSRQFAVEAASRHPTPFWEAQARMPVPARTAFDEGAVLRDAALRTALDALRAHVAPRLSVDPSFQPVASPIVLGHEVVVVPAIPDSAGVGVRYFRGVDLVGLLELITTTPDVGDIVVASGRVRPPATPADTLGAIAFLMMRGVLILSPPS